MSDDLARRAVACRHWRWMPGMLDTSGLRCVLVHASGANWSSAGTPGPRASELPNRVPDLTDPATLGCLLALVREAWGDEGIHVERYGPEWWGVRGTARSHPNELPIDGGDEAAALVAALEAAEGGEVGGG